jgi:hypothetical protein
MKVDINQPIRTGFLLSIGAFFAASLILVLLDFLLEFFSILGESGAENESEFLLILFAFICVTVFFIALFATKSRPATPPDEKSE